MSHIENILHEKNLGLLNGLSRLCLILKKYYTTNFREAVEWLKQTVSHIVGTLHDNP